MSSLRRSFSYLKPYIKEAVGAVMLLGLVVAANLAIPRLVQVIIDEGVVEENMEVILRTGLMMIGASLLSALFMVGNTILAIRASRGFEADLRDAIFEKIQTLSFGNLDEFTTGQLLTRLTSDLNQVRLIITMSIRMFTRMPLTFIGSITLMWVTNPRLSLIMAVLLPVTFTVLYFFVRRAQPLFTKVQEKMDSLNQVLQENLTGIRVVKAFVRQEHENNRFEGANEELYGSSLRIMRLLSLFMPFITLLLNMGTVAVLYYGGLQVFQGTGSVGEIIAFINYLSSAMFSVIMLGSMASQVSAAEASARRIYQVLDEEPKIRENPDVVEKKDARGKVVFNEVTFSYGEDGGEPVLSGINFTAESGETVAILGATGSGKSTLVHLIPRFYDVTGGSITIDGVDVRDFKLEELRRIVGISLQQAVLFSGTIRDNIKFGRPEATEEDVIIAAKAAQAHDFIMSFPDGYDSMVGQRGVNLSGGQKQRICIAQAILVKPKVLILDDSTSMVDVETEIKIEEALERLMNESTNFIIAQRISTVLKADKILVLENGKIAAEGNHSQLMETSPIYQDIYDSQLGGGVMQ
ncbi:ATP-binding cassette domain-containing protein [Candidatus Bathyarchaeota archaeon]|nr:ATP-binding cassette domain-containing protein [Candidatus Bathyarchaeota archaeon]